MEFVISDSLTLGLKISELFKKLLLLVVSPTCCSTLRFESYKAEEVAMIFGKFTWRAYEIVFNILYSTFFPSSDIILVR